MRNWLKEIRKKFKLTQKDVADKLEISTNYYCCIEKGMRKKKMDIELAEKLAGVFGVSIEYILNEERKIIS